MSAAPPSRFPTRPPVDASDSASETSDSECPPRAPREVAPRAGRRAMACRQLDVVRCNNEWWVVVTNGYAHGTSLAVRVLVRLADGASSSGQRPPPRLCLLVVRATHDAARPAENQTRLEELIESEAEREEIRTNMRADDLENFARARREVIWARLQTEGSVGEHMTMLPVEKNYSGVELQHERANLAQMDMMTMSMKLTKQEENSTAAPGPHKNIASCVVHYQSTHHLQNQHPSAPAERSFGHAVPGQQHCTTATGVSSSSRTSTSLNLSREHHAHHQLKEQPSFSSFPGGHTSAVSGGVAVSLQGNSCSRHLRNADPSSKTGEALAALGAEVRALRTIKLEEAVPAAHHSGSSSNSGRGLQAPAFSVDIRRAAQSSSRDIDQKRKSKFAIRTRRSPPQSSRNDMMTNRGGQLLGQQKTAHVFAPQPPSTASAPRREHCSSTSTASASSCSATAIATVTRPGDGYPYASTTSEDRTRTAAAPLNMKHISAAPRRPPMLHREPHNSSETPSLGERVLSGGTIAAAAGQHQCRPILPPAASTSGKITAPPGSTTNTTQDLFLLELTEEDMCAFFQKRGGGLGGVTGEKENSTSGLVLAPLPDSYALTPPGDGEVTSDAQVHNAEAPTGRAGGMGEHARTPRAVALTVDEHEEEGVGNLLQERTAPLPVAAPITVPKAVLASSSSTSSSSSVFVCSENKSLQHRASQQRKQSKASKLRSRVADVLRAADTEETQGLDLAYEVDRAADFKDVKVVRAVLEAAGQQEGDDHALLQTLLLEEVESRVKNSEAPGERGGPSGGSGCDAARTPTSGTNAREDLNFGNGGDAGEQKKKRRLETRMAEATRPLCPKLVKVDDPEKPWDIGSDWRPSFCGMVRPGLPRELRSRTLRDMQLRQLQYVGELFARLVFGLQLMQHKRRIYKGGTRAGILIGTHFCYGRTNDSWRPNLVRFVTGVIRLYLDFVAASGAMRTIDCNDFTYTHVQINVNADTPLHIDKGNAPGTKTLIIGFGDYEGGEFFEETPGIPLHSAQNIETAGEMLRRSGGEVAYRKGQQVPGQTVNVKHRPHFFEGSRLAHKNLPWRGTRLALLAYTRPLFVAAPLYKQRIGAAVADLLRLGMNLPLNIREEYLTTDCCDTLEEVQQLKRVGGGLCGGAAAGGGGSGADPNRAARDNICSETDLDELARVVHTLRQVPATAKITDLSVAGILGLKLKKLEEHEHQSGPAVTRARSSRRSSDSDSGRGSASDSESGTSSSSPNSSTSDSDGSGSADMDISEQGEDAGGAGTGSGSGDQQQHREPAPLTRPPQDQDVDVPLPTRTPASATAAAPDGGAASDHLPLLDPPHTSPLPPRPAANALSTPKSALVEVDEVGTEDEQAARGRCNEHPRAESRQELLCLHGSTQRQHEKSVSAVAAGAAPSPDQSPTACGGPSSTVGLARRPDHAGESDEDCASGGCTPIDIPEEVLLECPILKPPAPAAPADNAPLHVQFHSGAPDLENGCERLAHPRSEHDRRAEPSWSENEANRPQRPHRSPWISGKNRVPRERIQTCRSYITYYGGHRDRHAHGERPLPSWTATAPAGTTGAPEQEAPALAAPASDERTEAGPEKTHRARSRSRRTRDQSECPRVEGTKRKQRTDERDHEEPTTNYDRRETSRNYTTTRRQRRTVSPSSEDDKKALQNVLQNETRRRTKYNRKDNPGGPETNAEAETRRHRCMRGPALAAFRRCASRPSRESAAPSSTLDVRGDVEHKLATKANESPRREDRDKERRLRYLNPQLAKKHHQKTRSELHCEAQKQEQEQETTSPQLKRQRHQHHYNDHNHKASSRQSKAIISTTLSSVPGGSSRLAVAEERQILRPVVLDVGPSARPRRPNPFAFSPPSESDESESRPQAPTNKNVLRQNETIISTTLSSVPGGSSRLAVAEERQILRPVVLDVGPSARPRRPNPFAFSPPSESDESDSRPQAPTNKNLLRQNETIISTTLSSVPGGSSRLAVAEERQIRPVVLDVGPSARPRRPNPFAFSPPSESDESESRPQATNKSLPEETKTNPNPRTFRSGASHRVPHQEHKADDVSEREHDVLGILGASSKRGYPLPFLVKEKNGLGPEEAENGADAKDNETGQRHHFAQASQEVQRSRGTTPSPVKKKQQPSPCAQRQVLCARRNCDQPAHSEHGDASQLQAEAPSPTREKCDVEVDKSRTVETKGEIEIVCAEGNSDGSKKDRERLQHNSSPARIKNKSRTKGRKTKTKTQHPERRCSVVKSKRASDRIPRPGTRSCSDSPLAAGAGAQPHGLTRTPTSPIIAPVAATAATASLRSRSSPGSGSRRSTSAVNDAELEQGDLKSGRKKSHKGTIKLKVELKRNAEKSSSREMEQKVKKEKRVLLRRRSSVEKERRRRRRPDNGDEEGDRGKQVVDDVDKPDHARRGCKIKKKRIGEGELELPVRPGADCHEATSKAATNSIRLRGRSREKRKREKSKMKIAESPVAAADTTNTKVRKEDRKKKKEIKE